MNALLSAIVSGVVTAIVVFVIGYVLVAIPLLPELGRLLRDYAVVIGLIAFVLALIGLRTR